MPFFKLSIATHTCPIYTKSYWTSKFKRTPSVATSHSNRLKTLRTPKKFIPVSKALSDKERSVSSKALQIGYPDLVNSFQNPFRVRNLQEVLLIRHVLRKLFSDVNQ
ncbi:expressed unknown protein [Seminavis robusta]|uniref:Uncharacterized protein n=1 Tax=Seminavis robusta TaxID=568900 RepID=A0A9N8H903_9STRA|nr:expressed unknown protein [Seminavis robusta]|eukprot:Sro258_g101141.1  (107) ;mRNA; f:56015-56335